MNPLWWKQKNRYYLRKLFAATKLTRCSFNTAKTIKFNESQTKEHHSKRETLGKPNQQNDGQNTYRIGVQFIHW